MSVLSVCVSVCSHRIWKTARPNFTEIFVRVHAVAIIGPPLAELRYVSLCTSGFVDDFLFSHVGNLPMA